MHTMVANASCSLSILMLGFGMSSATSCGFMPFSPLTVLSSASAVSAALQSGAVHVSSVLHSGWFCKEQQCAPEHHTDSAVIESIALRTRMTRHTPAGMPCEAAARAGWQIAMCDPAADIGSPASRSGICQQTHIAVVASESCRMPSDASSVQR